MAVNLAGIDANTDVGSLGFTDDYNLVHLIAILKNPPSPGVANPDGVSAYATKLNVAVQAALPPEGCFRFNCRNSAGMIGTCCDWLTNGQHAFLRSNG